MQSRNQDKVTYTSGGQGILDAAEVLFAEKGFDAVSMNAIAKLAKTSKANIYHHFKNKNELYLSIMKAAVKRSSKLLDAIQDAPGTFRQRLADFAAGHLDNILAFRRSMQLVLGESLSGGSESGREIARFAVTEVFGRLIEMVRQGQQQDEFRQDIDPTLAAFMIVAANTFYFQSIPVMKYIPELHFSEDPDMFSKRVMDIFFNGIIQPEDQAK